MHPVLTDFLHHGILPFVGRAAERNAIITFWRTSSEADAIRVTLLTGELGVGKSRLVEESIPEIAREGGVVVHVKLRPESEETLGAMIGRALRFLIARRRIQIDAPGEETASVVAALRRLVRLRPTLLIFDDLHLLRRHTLEELAAILKSLSDESFALLCTTPPIETLASEIIRHYPVELMPLESLGIEELSLLWRKIFRTPPDRELLRTLYDATGGNPLALRSALRKGVESGAIVHDATSDKWHQMVPTAALQQILKVNVELLAAGMIAGLDPRQHHAAERLAGLGKVFSLEAAEFLLPDAQQVLGTLRAGGIVAVQSPPAPPVTSTPSKYPPFAFTHTLVHGTMAGRIQPDADELLRLIASGLPLYSTLPFRTLVRQSPSPEAAREELRMAIDRSLDTALHLDTTPQWELAMDAWRGGLWICDSHAELWAPEEERAIRIELLSCHLQLLRRSEDHAEYEGVVRQLINITAEPLPAGLLHRRLTAFSYRQALGRRKDRGLCLETWRMSQDLTGREPWLRLHPEYLTYLESAARSMLYLGEQPLLQEVEEELSRIIADDAAPPEQQFRGKMIIAFHFLDIFRTKEELAARLQVMREVEPYVEQRRRMSFLIAKIDLLCSIGLMHDALATANYAIPLFREHALSNNYYFGSLGRLCALGALGTGLQQIELEATALWSTAPADIPNFRLFAQMALLEMALLQDAREWLREGARRYAEAASFLRPEAQMLLGLELEMPTDRLPDVISVSSEAFRPAVEIFLHPTGHPAGTLWEKLRDALRAPILRIFDLLEKRAILHLITDIESRGEHGEIPEVLWEEMGESVRHALGWLAERSLPLYMHPFLKCGELLLPHGEIAQWREQVTALERNEEESQAAAEVSRLGARRRLVMLGTIELYSGHGEPVQIRGARLRKLLALMVADLMLDEPLSYQEFSTIVSDTDDLDKARKTLNGVVFRLREILGHDAIRTEGETPGLNLEMLDVDLLEAHRTLQEASDAHREGAYLRAQRRLVHVLSMTHGRVPFPTLYEDLFETVRVRFESELRSILLKVARELVEEGDAKSAVDLLRVGFNAMQEDEEIGELLCAVLITLDKRAETERVRMRIDQKHE